MWISHITTDLLSQLVTLSTIFLSKHFHDKGYKCCLDQIICFIYNLLNSWLWIECVLLEVRERQNEMYIYNFISTNIIAWWMLSTHILVFIWSYWKSLSLVPAASSRQLYISICLQSITWIILGWARPWQSSCSCTGWRWRRF